MILNAPLYCQENQVMLTLDHYIHRLSIKFVWKVKEDVSSSDIMEILILIMIKTKTLKEMEKRQWSEFKISFMFCKNYLLLKGSFDYLKESWTTLLEEILPVFHRNEDEILSIISKQISW